MPFGNNSELLQWCKDNGATSLSLNVALKEVALANGGSSPAFNPAIFQFLRSLGYTGAFNDMWWRFADDGRPVTTPGTYTYSLTVGVVGSTGRGDQTGATMTPAPEFVDSPAAWTRLAVGPTGSTQLTTNINVSNQFQVYLNFPGYGPDEFLLQASDTSLYTIWDSPVNLPVAVYNYLDTQLGNTIDFKIRVEGVIADLGTNEHWFRPEQNSSSDRGFQGNTVAGTYDPGYIARMDFTAANTTVIDDLRVNTGGLFIIDCPSTPTPGTPGPTVEFEGFNWGTPIALAAWNGFDFRASGQTALYNFLGTVLGTKFKVRVIGPGV